MTPTRIDLLSVAMASTAFGLAFAWREWLTATLALALGAFRLRALWRRADRHVEVARSAVEAAERDATASGARGAAHGNGGLSEPPERH